MSVSFCVITGSVYFVAGLVTLIMFKNDEWRLECSWTKSVWVRLAVFTFWPVVVVVSILWAAVDLIRSEG